VPFCTRAARPALVRDPNGTPARSPPRCLDDEGIQEFLLATNARALAVGVIIGAAVGKVAELARRGHIMPVITMAIPVAPGAMRRSSSARRSTRPARQ
jgi:hypothetical protein